MVIVEDVVQNLTDYLTGKKVLEVACGNSHFSIAAAKYAKEVLEQILVLREHKRTVKVHCLII